MPDDAERKEDLIDLKTNPIVHPQYCMWFKHLKAGIILKCGITFVESANPNQTFPMGVGHRKCWEPLIFPTFNKDFDY